MPLTYRRANDGTLLQRRHPHGYYIRKERRTWKENFQHIGAPPPLQWWEVYAFGRKGPVADFPTLREARQWCDEHPRGVQSVA
jgi:hypothetical protein